MAESTFEDEESDEEFSNEATSDADIVQNVAKDNEKSDLEIIDLENDVDVDDDNEEEASTTFIENVESDDDESSSYEKKFVRGVATPLGSAAHSSSSSSVASPAPTPSIGLATHTTTEEEDDDDVDEDTTNVTLSPNEVVVVGSETTFVTGSKASPDMSHVSVVVVGGADDICVIDSSLSSSSSHNRPEIVTPSRNDIGRSSSSASHSSSIGGPILPPPKSYSSSISDDDRNNDVGSPCSIILEGTTVDDTEDNDDVTKTSGRQNSTLPNGHVDSEEDSGVHVMAKSVDEFQELPHDNEIQKETVVSTACCVTNSNHRTFLP